MTHHETILSVAHLLVFLMLWLPLCEASGYFPGLKRLTNKTPITSSSTCGKTRTKYCKAASLLSGTCEEEECHFGCCASCTSSSPKSYNLKSSSSTLHDIISGAPRPGETEYSLGFDALRGSYIEVGRLPSIDYKKDGFTISVWVNQSSGNSGTIYSKSSVTGSIIYGIFLQDFSITLEYIPESSNKTETLQVTPLASQHPRNPNDWHFITVMVVSNELSYFLDGEYIGTDTRLTGAVKDVSGKVTVGRTYAGKKQYDGLMQDILFYKKALTNREVTEAFTGKFPSTYIAPECRCPPLYPKISIKLPAKCTKNSEKTESSLVSRLSDTSHPIEFATDEDPVSYWLSEATDQVTIDIDLQFGPLQIYHIITLFYGPLPGAILIERSTDRGRTYQPWQYYADDCDKSFKMKNNGPLPEPDSLNCLQYVRPYKYDSSSIAFRTDISDKQNVPLRPYGPDCDNLYCSPKLLAFIKATNVRLHFYNHTLFTNVDPKYFGLKRLLVAGRCECFGHAEKAHYVAANGTNNGSCTCDCHPSTNTEGKQCDRCKPLFHNKPFQRGSSGNAFPCIKCNCHNHASSCYYNRTLDPSPKDRDKGGGGVCLNCLHNTAGQHCETCEQGYYRKPGKSLDDSDVCNPCQCDGPGVIPGSQDCVKDDSHAAITPGQCQCKDNVTGLLCDQCKPGFYDLKSSHNSGCVSCNCDPRGTVRGDVTCHAISGQCNCKANVTGLRCDQCKAEFYNLSSSNPNGCHPCLCNVTGATSLECDMVSGKCPCRATVTGRQCERCDVGYHTLNETGCTACSCSPLGTRLGALQRCNPVSGKCQCKNYVTGYSCDQCISGYYNLQKSDRNGCTKCLCDTRGTLGNTKECHSLSGACTCKSNVTGANCHQCPAGFFNLSSSNPNGCQPCMCYPKGTKDGDTKEAEKLDCQSPSGQCSCLTNVQGVKCDECKVGYVWDNVGQGCISCNCNPDGSVSRTCNDTGFCICKSANGVGGQFCDQCLPSYHSFTKGRCSPCNCNKAGITKEGCDALGCFHCKSNVEGRLCDRCKPGTKSLKKENPFGCSGVPSQQGPPIVRIISSQILRITWDPPDNPNGLITSYVLFRNTTQVYNGKSRKFDDTDLRPYTLYSYYIVTYTDGGSVRSFRDGRVYRTKQDVPSSVARPNLTDVRARTAKAVWSYPITSNGILREFYLESTNSRDSTVSQHCQGLILACNLTNLRPYTVYNFTIRACTDAGCTTSQATTVLTRPTAPDSQPAPAVVPLPGGRRFSVSWDEPAEPNGVIFLYELFQRNYPSLPGDIGGRVYSESPSANPGAINPRNTTVTGLVPFSVYEYRVLTYTDQVSGFTSSNWTRQRTAEAVPEGEHMIRPQSYAVSSSEVNISWHLPSIPHGVIIRAKIYKHTNKTSFITPVLARIVYGSSSAVVSGLQPYTLYKFSVISCNSVGCTKHSSKTESRTLPSAPSGQEAPHGRPLNSTHLNLTWSLPAQPNGPVPPDYHVIRSPAAFHHPPINAIDGAHFPGIGYYRLSHTLIPAGIQTHIEFYFKTWHRDGLLVFLASAGREDFIALELRNGKPWFIFDSQTGPAKITVSSSKTFNDEQWHHLMATRERYNGTLIVDGVFRGSGGSVGISTVIDESTGIYIGGISDSLEKDLRRKGSNQKIINSVHTLSQHFIGCVKGLRLQNKVVSLDNAVEKHNVDPLSSGCPQNVDTGVYLKGGGYLGLKKDVFDGQKIYRLSFDFKTYYSSGLLLFVYGEKPSAESYLALVLEKGDLIVYYQTSSGLGNLTVSPTRAVCDGDWHNVDFTNFGKTSFALAIDGRAKNGDPVAVLEISSELYFGGVPPSSPAAEKLGQIGLKTKGLFGGCIKNIVTSRPVDLRANVVSLRNVDLSGCPKTFLVNDTGETCRNVSYTLVYTGRDDHVVDTNLIAFTDYLYSVESRQPGTKGGGRSPWFAVRSGEGAPEYRDSPHDVSALVGGRSITVSWFPPYIYYGVLRGYIIRAYNLRNSSLPPVEMRFNDVGVHNTTLGGLEPFTTYDVRVAAFTKGGVGESPGARVLTEESIPTGVRSPDVQRFPYSLFISWQRPWKPNGVIVNYILSVNSSEVYRGLNQTFNLTDLSVYSPHAVKLTACTKIGCADSDSVTIYTAEIPPQGVRPPAVLILGAHSAEVTWEKPLYPNGVIRSYQVQVTNRDDVADVAVYNSSDSEFQQTVTNLTAGTWYLFRITAINGGGATRSQPTIKRTVESSPEGIPAPDVRGLSPQSILVTIGQPRLPNGNITQYELYKVVGQNESLVLNGSKRNYTRSGLKPFTKYSFRSKICTAKGCGSSPVGCGYSLEAAPNGTVLLNVSFLNATSVLARWTTVHTPNGVVFYDLVASGVFFVEGSSSFETENATRMVSRVVHSKPDHGCREVAHPEPDAIKEVVYVSLLPYTSFKFHINASNTAGFILSNTVGGMTAEGAPIGLAAPNITILNSTAAKITWLRPARENGILLFYEVRRVNLETNVTTIANNGLQMYLVMAGLEPYTAYQFQVSASTKGGKSWSPETVSRTLQDIPSPVDPPKIPASKIDSRGLVVVWNVPVKPNGIIIHYIIYRNGVRRTFVPGNVTTLRVTGLEPFTVYTFSVGVCTIIGCSNSSLSRPVQTLQDVPEGQPSPVLSHAPGPSTLVHWSAPNVTNGIISMYQIQRRSELDLSNVTFVASIPANLSMEYQDRTVKPCTKYYYRVIAFTNAGGGTPSSWSNITTREGAPDVVPTPRTRTVNSSAIYVTWSTAVSQCTVTGYIIRVLENQRNYSKSTDDRSFTVNDLLPYTEYHIVVAGCVNTACRDSASSTARTLSSWPRDQPPPSATPIDSHSLRVTWEPPRVPAGRIVEFLLYRRTLDDPVSHNFTTPPYYVLIHRGIKNSFDDTGMGIFSEQQYKVTVINTEGNATSNDSQPFRTGPAPPQAGAILHGQAINHTSIFLNWTLPELKLLRGYVVSYEVQYKDLLQNIEYTYMKALDGSAMNLVVSPLKPSRDYAFRVILNNGAGTFASNDVTIRTMDGAPEGFDKPDVKTVNSTTIEVRWSPPTTPNGRITTYIIYANSTRVGNTSALYFNITALIPFTLYSIQVEVCTVYACIRSESKEAKTLPSVPQFLDPPRLLPGRRSMMVIWGSPRRPNGVMLEYKLFRRRLETCPTSPPPVTKCTYIECPLAEQLCDSTCYHPRYKVCCNGVLHDRDPSKTCCDGKYLTNRASDDVCCAGNFYPKRPGYQCCHGFYKLVNPGQICCKGSFGSVTVGDGNACCGGVPYNNNTKYCVCGTLYNDDTRHCCGGKVVPYVQVCCGGTESNGKAYDRDSRKMCCGTNYVSTSSLCCKSDIDTWKVYNYPSIASRDASGDKCCGTNKITTGLSCCNDQSYNASSYVCADKSTTKHSGCGTGTVCNRSAETTAFCNRCDFNRNTLICGYVDGYYSPVSPTSPSEDCGSRFTEIIFGNGELLSYNDQGLEPYTKYEYYVVARNTEGNVSSGRSWNTTLMDAPEGLVPPVVKVLSARSVEVEFLPPKKPNGIITEYRVRRLEQNSTGTTLVYRGTNLSYVDTSVRPFTGYLYILEACTSLCSNVSSENIVFTMESIPEDVSPPMLKALSSRSVEVKWKLPGRPNGIIIGYNISRISKTNHVGATWYRNSSVMVLVDTSGNLKPYTNYTYTVTACTKIGCRSSPRGFVVTLEAAPEGLNPPVLIPRTADSVEVYWNEPSTLNGVIVWYGLFRGKTLMYNGTKVCPVGKASNVDCTYVDRGLQPHTWYNYTVEASTSAGSTKSNRSRIRTPESSPQGIPVPTLNPQTSSSIQVSWTTPGTPNGVIVNYSVIVNTIREHYVGIGTQFTVSGLQPYTGYRFQVKACTVRGCGVGNHSYARTLEAPPEQQPPPGLVALSDAVVKVTWRPPLVPNGVITRYEVERRLLSSVPVIVFRTTLENGFQLWTHNSGLLPYRNYSYRIRAVNSAGSTRGPWATVRTLEGAPSGVYAPVVRVLNATTVTASWQQPRESNGFITLYELWSRESDNPSNKLRIASSTTPEQNVTVGGLKPNTNYEFQLAVSTVGGIGYSQWALAETLEASPLGLRPLHANKHVNGREITLSWEEPTQPNGVITDYIVYSDGVKVYSGISRRFTLARLQPFTSYSFQLEACTSAGCTKGPAQIITTAEIPPRLLQAPTFTAINSTMVTLEWQPPALPYGEIRLYQVLRSDSMFAIYNTTNKTSFTDTALQPFTSYEYKIRVENNAGSTESPPASVRTGQAPPAFVSAPVLTPRNSSVVEVSWRSPTKPNGIVISYTLRRNNTVVGHWASLLFFRDTSVLPATYYRYWLTVCTGGGCTDGDSSVVKTGESSPGVVGAPTLTVLSSVAIRVEWQPPEIANGLVTRYELFMNDEERYSGLKLSRVISALSPFTSYTFYVRACTSSGCTSGLSSFARTYEAPPEGLAKPTYTILGPSALEIRWSPPGSPNGVIKRYFLRRNGTIIYNGTELRYNDLQVLPYSYYVYKVTAVNAAGEVSSDPLLTNRTSPGTPEDVNKPLLTALSGTEIRVSWPPPGKPNGEIIQYLVLYNNIQVSVGVNMSYVARNLKYYTMYSFRVRACTSTPPCADSVESSRRTLEGLPSGQNAPKVLHIKARSVFVFWSPPLYANGVILRYFVQRTSISGTIVRSVGLSLNLTDVSVAPFREYQYKVLSSNSVGSATSSGTNITTGSAPPEQVPKPRLLNVSASTVVIAIDPPVIPNGEIVDYKVELSGVNVSSGLSTERTITELEPYSDYYLRVFACTSAGCTPSEAVSLKTGEGVPGEVEQPTFGEVTATSIHVKWSKPNKPNGVILGYSVLYKSICSENCVRKRAVNDCMVDVGLNTSYVITNLKPYTEYQIVIRVHNEKGTSDSDSVQRRTGPSDPEYVRKPDVDINGDVVLINWSKSFQLNGPLVEYVLNENNVMIFRGTSTGSGNLPNRGESEFIYVVSATTTVNGKKKTVKSLPFTVNISGVSPRTGGESDPWYQTIWFLVLISLFLILAVFAVVAVCLRRASGDRTVYVRERDPLPVRPKSRSEVRSLASNYTPSEAYFNIGMNELNHSPGSTIIGESEKVNRFDESLGWEPYTGSYGNPYDDDKAWTDEDEPDADRSVKYQIFTDTHL